VSPRFELETAVSKLTWLSKWVSPAELKDAVDNARSVLGIAGNHGSQGVSAKQTAAISRNEAPHAAAYNSTAAGNNAAQSQSSADGRSLTDEFNRMIAKKENPAVSDEDDVPMWDSVRKTENKNQSEVENVLSMIPGTIVP
jgi:DNA polymerase-3 subunit gamma/tau